MSVASIKSIPKKTQDSMAELGWTMELCSHKGMYVEKNLTLSVGFNEDTGDINSGFIIEEITEDEIGGHILENLFDAIETYNSIEDKDLILNEETGEFDWVYNLSEKQDVENNLKT
ncbi:hypothetical protein N9043_00785 [bacterium]|nr:hypothetical protein [bacterium]